MVNDSAISTLESAASDLGVLLHNWIHAHLETAPATEHSVLSTQSSVLIEDLDLPTINNAIQSLWRLVSVHKSIQQLRFPPPPPDSTDDQRPEFRGRVQPSVCPNPSSDFPDPSSIRSISSIQSTPPSADSLAEPGPICPLAPIPTSTSSTQSTSSTLPPSTSTAPSPSNHPFDPASLSASADTSLHPVSAGVAASPISTSAGLSRLSPTRLQPFNFSVPSVPTVPALHSLSAIVARTEQLHADVTSLISETNSPLPGNADLPTGTTPTMDVSPSTSVESAPNALGLEFLDIITRRPTFPGEGNALITTLRSELKTTPP